MEIQENNRNQLLARRRFLAGAAAVSLLALPGCASIPGLSLVDAVRRLLTRASGNALARLGEPGGFWDNQLARIALPEVFGSGGSLIGDVLTTGPVRNRLQKELNRIAEAGARAAAPLVADAVRNISITDAVALLRGGPTAATSFLRNGMGGSLVEAMVPELGSGLRAASDPVVGQAIARLTGVDVTGVARSLSSDVDDAIWGEIGREEAAIRENPESTNDPVLIAALKGL